MLVMGMTAWNKVTAGEAQTGVGGEAWQEAHQWAGGEREAAWHARGTACWQWVLAPTGA